MAIKNRVNGLAPRAVIAVIGTCVLLAGLALGLALAFKQASATVPVERVAHAGGGYAGRAYTNSLQAVQNSLNRGFRLIELDFEWTADDHLVCIHDWHFSVKRLYGREISEAPSLQAFRQWSSPLEVTSLELESLSALFRQYPQLILVTDIKQRNLDALGRIAARVDNYRQRVIPQIYQPEEYAAVKAMGFENVIWTLYRYSGDTDAVLQVLEDIDVFAVTMDRKRVRAGLALELQKRGIPVYAHTINKPDELDKLQRNMGVSEVYTDFLPHPGHSASSGVNAAQ